MAAVDASENVKSAAINSPPILLLFRRLVLALGPVNKIVFTQLYQCKSKVKKEIKSYKPMHSWIQEVQPPSAQNI